MGGARVGGRGNHIWRGCSQRTWPPPTMAPRCRPLPLQEIGALCQLVVICGRNKKLAEKLQKK